MELGLRLLLVMLATRKPEVGKCVGAAKRKRRDVVDFEAVARGAAPSLVSDLAATLSFGPHGSPEWGGKVDAPTCGE